MARMSSNIKGIALLLCIFVLLFGCVKRVEDSTPESSEIVVIGDPNRLFIIDDDTMQALRKYKESEEVRKQRSQNPRKHELDNMPLYMVDPNAFPNRTIVVDPNGYIIRYY